MNAPDLQTCVYELVGGSHGESSTRSEVWVAINMAASYSGPLSGSAGGSSRVQQIAPDILVRPARSPGTGTAVMRLESGIEVVAHAPCLTKARRAATACAYGSCRCMPLPEHAPSSTPSIRSPSAKVSRCWSPPMPKAPLGNGFRHRRSRSLTMGKPRPVRRHLLDHESQMQDIIRDMPGTPNPIGSLATKLPPVAPPSYRPRSRGEQSYPCAIVYQHGLGYEVSDEMSESDVSETLYQVREQLERHSEKGAHFRDLNPGNILWKRSASGKLELLLMDHGNVRFDGGRRASANPLFLPSSVHRVEKAMEIREVARERRLLAQQLGEAPLAEEVGQKERRCADAQRDIMLYSHCHIDDLESCSVSLYDDLRRSCAAESPMYATLINTLYDAAQKAELWASSDLWATSLARFRPRLSSVWGQRIIELRLAISSG